MAQRGAIKKRGKSTHTAYFFTTDENGKRTQHSQGGFATKAAAREFLNETLALIQKGLYVERDRQTTEEFLATWLEGRRDQIAPTTFSSYKGLVDSYVVPGIGSVGLQDLRPQHLTKLYADLRTSGMKRGEGGLSKRTVTYIHVVIARALSDAERWGLVPRNVARLVDPPGNGGEARGCWTVEQARVFLRATADDRLAALWQTAIGSGCRRGELLGATWDDLDDGGLHVRRGLVQVDGVLRVQKPKTARGFRYVPLDAEVVGALREHHRRQVAERLKAGEAWQAKPFGLDLVFRDELGGALRPQRILRAFQAAARRARVPVTPFHSLRHFCAVMHARNGTPRTVAAEILGHDVRMLEGTYQAHAQPDLAIEAVRKIAATLRGD